MSGQAKLKATHIGFYTGHLAMSLKMYTMAVKWLTGANRLERYDGTMDILRVNAELVDYMDNHTCHSNYFRTIREINAMGPMRMEFLFRHADFVQVHSAFTDVEVEQLKASDFLSVGAGTS